MQIELKNTDFKDLYEWLLENTDISTPIIGEIIHEELKPQYEKAFLKYKDEKQKFNVGDKVRFDKGENTGIVVNVTRLQNGKFKYGIEYSYISDTDDDGNIKTWDSRIKYLTDKNLEKI